MQARCRLPVRQAVNVLGVLDESATIPTDCIHFCYHPRGADGLALRTATHLPAGTRVVVSRSPVLSAADIRVLTIVDPAAIHPAAAALEDVIVFSQFGERPAPSLMSGGDLDGDLYFVVWDQELIPPVVDPPAEYAPGDPPQPCSGAYLPLCRSKGRRSSALMTRRPRCAAAALRSGSHKCPIGHHTRVRPMRNTTVSRSGALHVVPPRARKAAEPPAFQGVLPLLLPHPMTGCPRR